VPLAGLKAAAYKAKGHGKPTATANARTLRVGEAQQWDRRDVKIDDTPLVSVAAAYWRWSLQEAQAPMPAIY